MANRWVALPPCAGALVSHGRLAISDAVDSDAGALRMGGRYNPAGEFGALYLAESEDACRAEVTRRIEPEATLSLGALEVDLEAVCDLTDPAVCQALGVTRSELVGDDWSITQGIGRALRDAGSKG